MDTSQVTGLVLAGGRGLRMGGVDKGLQPLHGRPLVQHALERLAPQVSTLLINANRHLDDYRAFGWPVVADAQPEAFDGPLAGLLGGMQAAPTEWLCTVPCDSPLFPADLVARLAQAAAREAADIAMACAPDEDGRLWPQPVFCLVRCRLAPSLNAFLQAGGRKIDAWTGQHATALAHFDRPGDEPRAFFNANTLAELASLQAGPHPPTSP